MVEVFREVRRVLARHGTCWVNLGDSYTAGHSDWSRWKGGQTFKEERRETLSTGLKPKDLVGVPWRVAQALQAPYYTGSIKNEVDRAWLAALIDGEGCIYIARSPVGALTGRERKHRRTQDCYSPGITITNRNRALLERAAAIVGHGKIHARKGGDHFEWRIFNTKAREVLRELYPHLVAKQAEARLAYGCPSSGDDARKAWESLKALHQGQSAGIDFRPPEGMWEAGWFLRSEIIWAKCMPNPMPESVTDRPTKAHEQVFLLTKQPRYFYDGESIREPHTWGKSQRRLTPKGARGDQRVWSPPRDEYVNPNGRNARSVWEIATQPYPEAHFATFPEELARRCILAGCPERVCRVCGKPSERIVEEGDLVPSGSRADAQQNTGDGVTSGGRPGHALAFFRRERTSLGWSDCGCEWSPLGHWRSGVVLDPFLGSGTTALVARNHGRHAIGIELSAEYAELAAKRTRQLSLLAEAPPALVPHKGLTGGAYSPPGQSPHSNARPKGSA